MTLLVTCLLLRPLFGLKAVGQGMHGQPLTLLTMAPLALHFRAANCCL